MADQVDGVVVDNPFTIQPCPMNIIGAIQCLVTYNTNNSQLLPALFEWSVNLSIKYWARSFHVCYCMMLLLDKDN